MCATTTGWIENPCLGVYKSLAPLPLLLLHTSLKQMCGQKVPACYNTPTRERISRFLAFLLPNQFTTVCCVLANFSAGRRASISQVSSTIPKNSSVVEGPDTLCVARGTPSTLHTLMMLFRLW